MVTRVWHDCFVVETGQWNLVFDYWVNPPGEPKDAIMPEAVKDLDPRKPIMVFVSHGHKDHYNPRIFDWSSRFEHIEYVVSKDVWQRIRHILSPTSNYKGVKVDRQCVHKLTPGESFSEEGIMVTACGSTDIGNSYLVRCGTLTIFHAGDLNAWTWPDESTPEEVQTALDDFNRCLDGVAEALGEDEIDLCFFPVDPRMGRYASTGAGIIRRRLPIRHFIPMHDALN